MWWLILIGEIEEYAPIVYTPTVGLVCQKYSGLFRRPRGMYFSAADRGEMMSMVYNWPADQVCYLWTTWLLFKIITYTNIYFFAQVDMIVVTDGSRILGLGDLGVKGSGFQ